MKQHLRFLFTLLLAIVCGGAMFGQTTKSVTCTLGKNAKSCTSTGDCSVSWTYSTDPTTTNQTQNGMYWAIDKSETVTLTATLSDKNATITSVVITGYTNKGAGKTIDVTVGGKTFGKTISLETTSKDYTLSGSAAGDLALILKSTTTTKSHIIKTVKINYTESSSATEQGTTLSFPSTSVTANVGETITIPAATLKAGETELTDKTITYSCEGDKTGVVESFDPTTRKLTLGSVAGTATVTAKFAGDATYAASSASYTITVQDNRTTPTLTFDKESYTFDLGATVAPFTNQLTAPEGVTVVYSSNSEIATVNETTGEVTVNTAAVGKATITATFAGNETYAPATVTYTIEVKKPILPPTFDFTQSKNDYGSGATPGDNYIESSIWTSGKVKMVTSKGNSQGFRWWQKTDGTVLRSYDGCSLTISVNKGLLINSIEFDGVINGFAADKGTLKSGKWTGSAQTVTFSFSAKKDIKSITVTYEKDATFTLETLTTAASGFATYAADYDVNYSALGLTTYAITLDEVNNKVSYNRFEGVVPAGKAVLVQGTASTPYALTPAEGAADATFNTDLKASDGTVTAADDKIYAFGTLNGKSGFKLVTNGITIPAKKGYLQLTGTTAAKPTFFAFDGIGTGISHIEADAALENAAMYNLAGQRVDKSYKGVVIVNGKKMLRK